MAFKMKNKAAMQMAKMAGDSRVAMKMKKEEPMMMKEPMKMKKGPMTMKKEAAMKKKMKMVKGPKGNMVPDYAVDGKGAGDLA